MASDGLVLETRDEALRPGFDLSEFVSRVCIMSVVERCRELPGAIESVMRRRRAAE
jgi:TPP-dependent indolepyruvate ferredoxin oxidoreductase alpha subunit